MSTTDAFIVNVTASCGGTTLTAAAISAITYSIGSTASSNTFTAMTVSGGSCTTVTYTLTTSTGAVIDSSIFTFTPSTRKLVISTSLASKVGSYSLKLTGTLPDLTTIATKTFTVTVTYAACSSTWTTTHPALNNGYNSKYTFTLASGTFCYYIASYDYAASWVSTSSGSGTNAQLTLAQTKYTYASGACTISTSTSYYYAYTETATSTTKTGKVTVASAATPCGYYLVFGANTAVTVTF
jgi:hypothetical protein